MIKNNNVAYVNGKIYTMRQEGEYVSAVVVRDGKFVYCGNDDEAKRISANIVDLGGKTVLPGFVDSHQHIQNYAKDLSMVDLRGAKDLDEILERMANRIKSEPKGKLVMGANFNQSVFADPRMPTRWDLDKVSPDNPVVIKRYCMHYCVANSYAIALAEKNAPQGTFDSYEHDSDGVLTGSLDERQTLEFMEFMNLGDGITYEELKDSICQAIQLSNAVGITSIHPIQGKLCNIYEQLGLYQELYDEDRLTARICFGDDDFPECGFISGMGNEMVKFGFYKIYSDGSFGARTALLSQPYSDAPDTIGICHYTQEELDEMVKDGYDKGIQVAIHAIGDQAITMVVNAMEKAYRADPRPYDKVRFRLIHCSLMTRELIDRIASLPIMCDLQPSYVSTNILWNPGRVGEERAKYLFAWGSIVRAGIIATGSSDIPVEPLNPLVAVYATETRKGYDGYMPEGFQPQEKLKRYDILCFYTKNGAYASFEEDVKGTIETGKYADFSIFDTDVFGVDADDLLKIKVLKTFLGGQLVYSQQ